MRRRRGGRGLGRRSLVEGYVVLAVGAMIGGAIGEELFCSCKDWTICRSDLFVFGLRCFGAYLRHGCPAGRQLQGRGELLHYYCGAGMHACMLVTNDSPSNRTSTAPLDWRSCRDAFSCAHQALSSNCAGEPCYQSPLCLQQGAETCPLHFCAACEFRVLRPAWTRANNVGSCSGGKVTCKSYHVCS